MEQPQVTKQILLEIIIYIKEDIDDKIKTYEALQKLLESNIQEQDSVILSINTIYQRYLQDTELYTKIFQLLNINPSQEEPEEAEEIEIEKPTKKEQETMRKQLELEKEDSENKKTLEEEAEEYEQNKFKQKMKETNNESVLEKLGLLKKKWSWMNKKYIKKEKEYIDEGILKLRKENSNINMVILLLLGLFGITFMVTLDSIQLLSLVLILSVSALVITKNKYYKTIEELKIIKSKIK